MSITRKGRAVLSLLACFMLLSILLTGCSGAASAKKTCRYCEAEIPAVAKYCPKCGQLLLSVCPSCGTDVDEQDKFCKQCGASLSNPAHNDAKESKEAPSVDSSKEASPTETPAVESSEEASSTATVITTPGFEMKGDKTVSIGLGEKIKNEYFTMSLDSLKILSDYKYELGERTSSSITAERGYKLLLLRGRFENLTTGPIKSSCFSFAFTVNDTFVKAGNDVSFRFMRMDIYEIDAYTEIGYCLYINIPEKLAEQFERAVITVGFNDDMSKPATVYNNDASRVVQFDTAYVLSCGAECITEEGGNELSVYKTLVVGQTVSARDYDLKIRNVEFSYEVKPANTSSVYSSYKAESGKIFIHIDGYYTNNSKKDICIRDLPIAVADYDEGHKYSGFAIVDDGDDDFDWVSSYVICHPLETCHYHCLIECPEIVKTSDKALFVTMTIDETLYRINIK
ncbi:MAG: zinc ribbon domain-containing protein [Lachnospiraceae bacterium]|nr:zinc ribbon domain-containing protein [Lachnospiraceae bacterium]